MWAETGEVNMKRVVRLEYVSRVAYYLALVATFLGALSHFSVRINLRLDSLQLTQRNLIEASLLLFIMSMASELRVIASKLPAANSASTETITRIPAKRAA
jgi:hypothetical protein